MRLFDRLSHPQRWFTGLSEQLATDLDWSVLGVRVAWIVLGIIQPLITISVYFGLSVLYPSLRSR